MTAAALRELLESGYDFVVSNTNKKGRRTRGE
jgi:hypothetical protein